MADARIGLQRDKARAGAVHAAALQAFQLAAKEVLEHFEGEAANGLDAAAQTYCKKLCEVQALSELRRELAPSDPRFAAAGIGGDLRPAFGLSMPYALKSRRHISGGRHPSIRMHPHELREGVKAEKDRIVEELRAHGIFL